MYTPAQNPKSDHVQKHVQLATLIPADLLREVKAHCVQTEDALYRFVRRAMENQLRVETVAETVATDAAETCGS